MNTNYHRNEQTRLMGEAQAHLDLGLREEAEFQIDQYIATFGADRPSLEMKLGMVNTRGDYQMAAAIAKGTPAITSGMTSALHDVNISGDPEWSFSNCLLLEPDRSGRSDYWFNRACFASGTGRFPEAMRSLMRCFRLSGHSGGTMSIRRNSPSTAKPIPIFLGLSLKKVARPTGYSGGVEDAFADRRSKLQAHASLGKPLLDRVLSVNQADKTL